MMHHALVAVLLVAQCSLARAASHSANSSVTLTLTDNIKLPTAFANNDVSEPSSACDVVRRPAPSLTIFSCLPAGRRSKDVRRSGPKRW